MTQAAFSPLADRALIRISGPEAQHFLQSLVTCDMEDVDSHGVAFGALLTPQGKIQFDFFIIASDQGYLIDTPAQTVAELTKRLGFYKLRAKVDIAALESPHGVVAIWGKADIAHHTGLQMTDPRLSALGLRCYGPVDEIVAALKGAGAEEKTADDYHLHRLCLAVPQSLEDYEYSDIFPHDANMDQLNGVSFTKGCYVGQEVVSRVQHRGTSRKRFVSVSSDKTLPAAGADIMAGERSVGTLGSSIKTEKGWIGLALVRLDKVKAALDADTPVETNGIKLGISIPEWAAFSWPGTEETN